MSVNKFYLSEKFGKDNVISFNLKKEGAARSKNFKTFKEALEQFQKDADKLEGESRVWFHRGGQFSGSTTSANVVNIIDAVASKNVKDEKAIEFINEEKLVDVSAAKEKAAKKAESAEPKAKAAKTTKAKTSKVTKVDEEAKFNFDNSKLPAEVFNLEKIYEQAIFDTIMSERASRRQGTHSVKSRAEVSGGGKKPWRQKGTGRARAGSTRSPIWVGGGRAFGPRTERNYNLKVNKKAKKAAFLSALTLLAQDNAVIVDDFKLANISTKEAVAKLDALKLTHVKHVLVVSSDETVYKSLGNVANVAVIKPASVTVEALIWADVLVLSNEGLTHFVEKGRK
ncbi:50S ribosomal protein L4 [Mycoplasma sp. ES3157-GEN-MYC]|uniref:Large ribosomal subunit protein uL4 n=1 Tax=Mycoplasma miroungigenitalium TaxID=754515 RepID=A0A6M4JDX3_9MOLU|nr:50S ribosomal protein L4 [Mycoplasma miroungigenitalium]MBU4690174.1 50S ribosomal protein L4 [Mycoplasma miroungigenitalium]MBU4691446.1 50S ribosomal protein L4 [Mycoplasma miroungigenitalium]QJR43282.1 50S ribosomal protein L4 [Mycoplasma miroungigenitalium]